MRACELVLTGVLVPDGNEHADLSRIFRDKLDGANRTKANAVEENGGSLGEPLNGAIEDHVIVLSRRSRGVVFHPVNEAQEQSEKAKDEYADDEMISPCFHAL